MFDIIVVGSGPAGTWAAHEMKRKKVLILDVGHEAPDYCRGGQSLLRRRQCEDMFRVLIGDKFDGLANLTTETLSPKLKAPLMRFITAPPEGNHAIGYDADEFKPTLSYALGGLANAWGAGLYRFNAEDLTGYPFTVQELDSKYAVLASEIGISGRNDDLTDYFGYEENLQPPVKLNRLSERFLKVYALRAKRLNLDGFYAGYARLAVLSKPLGDRHGHEYCGDEFFVPNIPSIYHPGYTLRRIIERGNVQYLKGYLVKEFEEGNDLVHVRAVNLAKNSGETFVAKRLILAAGAINTAKIVLQSRKDYSSRLPLLDNPVAFLPLVSLRDLGAAVHPEVYHGGQLNVLYKGKASTEPILTTFYALDGPMRADFFTEYPLTLKGRLHALKYVTPAIAMAQVFYPADPQLENHVQLMSPEQLVLRHGTPRRAGIEKQLAGLFRKTGFLTVSNLARSPVPGSSIHYAGMCPMRQVPSEPWECDRYGKLNGWNHVFVADGACFPRLPAKNLSLTIMANAMRVAEHVEGSLE